ncbi:cytochrome ubiquinol oxidase subunit I [Culturomica massiliensis]|uniref:cytochrome ubiquinol oxidase subunit I n=1 Tax=Culturomica massiliensis TaxID=1841857 RepID=UPI003AB5E85F
MEPDFLSRIQFALTAGFHFLFPPISIGLSVFVLIVEALWVYRGDQTYKRAAKFFLKLFSIIFAVGVVTGIVLEFEFGTNWPIYSKFVGDVFGGPLAIEALFAFFMESVFLGVAVWGWDKIGKKKHLLATLLVCVGTHLSAVWIIAANSFMQTPAGYQLTYTSPAGEVRLSSVPTKEQIPNTRAEITDFWDMALSPSMADRFTHTIAGSWLCGAFFAIGVCGFLILKGSCPFAKPCAKIALAYGGFAALFMLYTGHSSAKNLAVTQPEKLAALEGLYESENPADLYAFGWVDEEKQKVSGVKLPGFLTLLCYGSYDGEIKGLRELPSDEFLGQIYPGATKKQLEAHRPKYWAPVNFCFQTFRIMVYLGAAMAVFLLLGYWLWIKGRLFDTKAKYVRIFWKFSMYATLMPIIACQFGWAAAEVGRQPWILWHILKTSDAATTSASASEILFGICLFSAIFIAVAVAAVAILFEKIRKEA